MLVKLDHVKKHYATFDLDCTMALAEGCITGVIGRNGAGKTTTFKLILDLIHPDAGEITVLDEPVSKLNTKKREQIGVVLSDSGFSESLHLEAIARILKPMYHTFDPADFKKQAQAAGLPLHQPLSQFSNGMKAKAKLLMALSHHPRLLILDEPTAGLDVVARDEVLDMLRAFMENEQAGILISSHISSDLEGLCDDIYLIDQGKVKLHESNETILSEYGLIKVNASQYEKLDKDYLLAVEKEGYGYACLTNQRAYYQENYPGIVVEKANLDRVLTIMSRGESK